MVVPEAKTKVRTDGALSHHFLVFNFFWFGFCPGQYVEILFLLWYLFFLVGYFLGFSVSSHQEFVSGEQVEQTRS